MDLTSEEFTMKKFLLVLTLALVGCDDPRHLEVDIDKHRYETAMALKKDLEENRYYYDDAEIKRIEEEIKALHKNNKYY